jgi:hypothetical protein
MFHREQRLYPYGTNRNGSQRNEQALTHRKTEFLELLLLVRDSNPFENSRAHEIVPNTVYQIIEANGIFQGETIFIFVMTHARTLAPARTINWDAVG